MARISFKERTIGSQPLAGTTFAVNTPTHIVSTLEFESGLIGTLTTSFDVWAHEQPRFEIYGSEGTLSLDAPNGLNGPVRTHGETGESQTELVHGFQTLSPAGVWRWRIWSGR